ncbi:MAG TPA: hypothetical protein VIJ54_08815, partial [Actinomycetes bacterium]
AAVGASQVEAVVEVVDHEARRDGPAVGQLPHASVRVLLDAAEGDADVPALVRKAGCGDAGGGEGDLESCQLGAGGWGLGFMD